ncbi:hypothetical protein AB4090_13865 [Acidithiobacillus sp. IBUN Pt1247-S3]|uniref:hypothetical protein n=1 Tax=Acidithiobacillus sp. IBUN Pt1247-S3 TaxID=3166642 RepID=UPI0034E56892
MTLRQPCGTARAYTPSYAVVSADAVRRAAYWGLLAPASLSWLAAWLFCPGCDTLGGAFGVISEHIAVGCGGPFCVAGIFVAVVGVFLAGGAGSHGFAIGTIC